MIYRTLRLATLCALGAAVFGGGDFAMAQLAGRHEVISESMARRHGLTRAWITRVQLDPGRGRAAEMTLHEDLLISVTDAGVVQALDAESGRTHWLTKVGRRNLPNTPVGASASYVAMCNGSTLYVLSRRDGSLLFTQRMAGAPSTAPAVSEERIYIPTFAGAIESYPIKAGNEHGFRFSTTYRSKGTIEEPPVLAGENLIWGTHDGGVYSVTADKLQAIFRFSTRGQITAGLGYWPPLVYAASADGYIYGIDENTGKRAWQFSSGSPSRDMPVPLDGNVYAISELSGMFCLTADRGLQRWFTRDVAQFISASPTRLYTADGSGRLMVLDRQSGAHLDSMPTELLPIKVLNIQTDRIYLGTATGIVQCLREIDLVRPFVHALPPAPAEAVAPPQKKPAAAAEMPAAEAPAEDAGADDPFAAGGQP
jgi:outer membrane protein assembly factor BamB